MRAPVHRPPALVIWRSETTRGRIPFRRPPRLPALLLAAGSLAAAEPLQRTQAPLTYIRDYAAGHLDDENFLAAIAANTPELLVLGKDAPIHHNWGPVAGTGGENQSFGQGGHIRRLSPGELREKMERIRKMVARLRATGVRWIMPYLCTMTVGGDPDRRTGFWEFYDHWDEYRAFGLGPKPREDPLRWMQRRPDGELHFYYPPDSPRYAPNRRWAACIHQPGWRQHLQNVVRLAGEVGYDGVYFDNNRSTRCHCDRCQEEFRAYVAARLTPAEIQRDLGAKTLAEVRLNPDADPFVLEALTTTDRPAEPPRLKPGVDRYHVKLTWEFWTDSKVEFLRELKTIGAKARGSEFHIFANTTAYSKGAYEPGRVGAVATFNQSEENGAETGAHPGRVPPEIGGPQAHSTGSGQAHSTGSGQAHSTGSGQAHSTGSGQGITHNRRAFEYKFYQSFAYGMRVGMLTRPGHGLPDATRDAIEQNAQTASLSVAESAAFGGGGGYKMQLAWDTNNVVRLWRTFFEQHRPLYEGMEAWAPVGVIAFGEQFLCGLDKTHQEALRDVSGRLLENGVLFDLVHEGNFSLERLRRFRAVLVPPGVRSLSAGQLEIFRRYAQEKPGALVVMGDDFGSSDEKCRPRPAAQRTLKPATTLPPAPGSDRLLAALARPLGRTAVALVDATGKPPAMVGLNAFIAPSNSAPRALMLHLVNYDVPLGQDRTDPPRSVRDLTVTLPIPPGWQPAAVEVFSPHPRESLAITFEAQHDVVRLRIPRLDLYKAIRISGREASH